jgi:hypothetical protein
MVFNTLDHYFVLEAGVCDLHSPRTTNRWVWDITVAGDFVRCVDNNNPFASFIGKNPCGFTEDCGFTNTGSTQNQNALA